MKKIEQKIKHNTNSLSIVNNNNLKERMLRGLFISFGVLAFCYIIVLSSMISSVIARKGLENDIKAVSSEIGSLELVYLDVSNKIDLDYSHSLGFVETKPIFAVRKSLGFNTVQEHNIQLAKNEI